HRMFSFISNNWAAHPLIDYETVLKFIRATKTFAGLKILAALHTRKYQKGIRICAKKMNKVNLKYYTQRPDWNYSINPMKNVN
ncbi:MAG: ISAzo13 family transposase, partial [Deltaproteobacteria bacterium]|nr:ISAzo13 family transposase [Deltaproteobacteria bacterium]